MAQWQLCDLTAALKLPLCHDYIPPSPPSVPPSRFAVSCRSPLPSLLQEMAGMEGMVLSGANGARNAGKVEDRLLGRSMLNQSLSALCHCVSIQSKNINMPKANRHSVPYDSSVVTMLLRNTLEGHDRVFVIATLSPSACSHVESLHTLRFADHIHKLNGVLKKHVGKDQHISG